jgi:hypothetical protein
MIMKLSNYSRIFKALSNEQRLKLKGQRWDQSSGSRENPAAVSRVALIRPLPKYATA